MNVLKTNSVSLLSISNMQDEILIKKLLLTHDPDGRWLDSETMLHAVGNIMYHAFPTGVASNLYSASFPILKNDITEIELLDCPEPVGLIIREISYKILCKCSGECDLNSTIMSLFDLIREYRWDAKVVLVLAAFSARYGEFRQLIQLYPHNNFAASIVRLRQLPCNLRPMRPQIKALSLLVKTMMDVAMCIIRFESLPIQHIETGNEMLRVTRSLVYIAAYWITRSCVACFSQVMDFRTKKHEQDHEMHFHNLGTNVTGTANRGTKVKVYSNDSNAYRKNDMGCYFDVSTHFRYSDSTIIAAWELSSFTYRLSGICNILRAQVDMCRQQIERNLQDKLLNLVDEVDIDNQKVLNLLFPTKNSLPLKDCSTQVKLGVSELKNKIVMLLISNPQLLSLEELLLLVKQTCDHPLNETLKDSYKIVWVPLPSSDTWTDAEETSFNFLSDSLPWYAVSKPRLLSSAVAKYIREEWNYKEEEPLMVVLDSNGKVTNSNALDMIMIWGASTYPFSESKEAELWQDQNLTMQLLLGDINHLLAYWVEQGKNLCIYGSRSLAWIQQFNDNITKLKLAGLQLETIYVGNSKLSEHIKQTMENSADITNLSGTLSFTKVRFFWLRLECMRRSKLRLGKAQSSDDHVLAELSALLDMDDREELGWAVIGSGSSDEVIRIEGMQLMEFLGKYHEWGENVDKLGLLGAARSFLDPNFIAGPCNHSYLVPSSEEGLTQANVYCKVCRRPMKEFVVYQP